MKVTWCDISTSPRNKNRFLKTKYYKTLHYSSGSFCLGDMVAIMGPSGSGKSSLLSALSCRVPSDCITNGVLEYNDESIKISEWMKITGYVGTNDALFENLTVESTIKMTAAFRMKDNSMKNINDRYHYLISKFHLSEISGLLVSKLSLGERKRLMIVCELITDAEIIFIDEPIGEMDSMTAFDVINSLHHIAKNENKAVVIAVDQPTQSIFNFFDKLVVLDQGKEIFSGEAKKCKDYLSDFQIINEENLAFPEFLMQIFHKDVGYEERCKYEAQLLKIEEHNKKNIKTDEKSAINKNISHNPKRINRDDISLLMKRRFDSQYTSKVGFIRQFYFKFLALAFLSVLLFRTISNRAEKGIDFLPSVETITKNIKNDTAVIKSAKYLQISYLVSIIPSFIALFCLYQLFATFYYEHSAIEREIRDSSYSVTSYYFSVLIYEMAIQFLHPFFIFTIILLVYFKICTVDVCAVFVLSTVFLVPFALLLGSLSFDKRRVIFISIFFGLLIIVPPVILQELITHQETFNDIGMLTYSYVYLFIPYHYFTSTMGYIAIKQVKNILGNKGNEPVLKPFIELLDKKLDKFTRFAGDLKMHPILMGLLSLILPIFCILVTISVLSIKFKPELRTKLSKISKKSSKKEILPNNGNYDDEKGKQIEDDNKKQEDRESNKSRSKIEDVDKQGSVEMKDMNESAW